MFDLHILIVSPKHASLILFIFSKEGQRGRLLEIQVGIVSCKNKLHDYFEIKRKWHRSKW